jgi:hypothetical protein
MVSAVPWSLARGVTVGPHPEYPISQYKLTTKRSKPQTFKSHAAAQKQFQNVIEGSLSRKYPVTVTVTVSQQVAAKNSA